MAKVCAFIHIDASWSNEQCKFSSLKEAKEYFKKYAVEESVMDIYFSDDCECDSMMNFHDYPSARYVVGPRGGVRREYV